MFSDIGGKIKILAIIMTVLGIFVSVVGGIDTMDYDDEAGLLIIIVGSLSSWIMSFFVYGFGEMISHLKRSNELSEQILRKLGGSPASMPDYTPSRGPISGNRSWKCSCGTENRAEDAFCRYCRNRRD